MTSIFHPRRVNPPFGDPGLFVPFCYEKRAILFDLGDIHSLTPRDLLKITHAFVTHTHMDHFIGFDHLLRLMLGRKKTLNLFGPAGFLACIEGKLAGYTWNLLENDDNRLILNATEVHPDYLVCQKYRCSDKFLPQDTPVKRPFNKLLLDEPLFSVSAAILDHSIPCLGFTIKERFHVNIKKTEVDALGLAVGPWLNDFKNALFEQQPDDSIFDVRFGKGLSEKKSFVLRELREKIARITPGQKISYITDVLYSRENIDKIISLSDQADHLFIEAAFLEKERDMANQKCHLTAGQAGEIAGLARVKRFTLFHFSPRYIENEGLLHQEAMATYERVIGSRDNSSDT